MKRIICVLALGLMASAAAFADIPRPVQTPSKSIDANLDIRLDRTAKEAKLVIPASQIKQLRAQLEQLDNDGSNAAAATTSFSNVQTIVSGVFLSLAFVFGGIWFMRSGRATPKMSGAAAALAVIAGIVSAATLVYGNAGPPAEARTINSKMFTQSVHMYKHGWGKIKLEVTNKTNDRIELIVPDPETKPPANDE